MSAVRKLISLIFLSVLFFPTLVLAQEGVPPTDPAWVDYEKGMLEISRREYGKALLNLKKALSQARVMPEAEMAIGDVYFLQGDYAIAERQYKKAWDERNAFQVPKMRYQALYKLSRLYFLQQKYAVMEDELNRIVGDDALFEKGKEVEGVYMRSFREILLALFMSKGFDEMFKLNRIDESFASNAYAELAHFYYISYRFEYALDYALFGVIPVVTEAMKEIRRLKPGYRYSTLTDFLRVGLAMPTVRDYLADREFYKRLYYIGLICYELVPVRDSGIEFLRVLAATNAAGDYQRLAGIQLKTPFREKHLDVDVLGLQ